MIAFLVYGERSQSLTVKLSRSRQSLTFEDHLEVGSTVLLDDGL
jgi:hypothetical protein